MILLDTNVVSEIFKPKPAEAVAAWFGEQSPPNLFLCAPVMAELRHGVVTLAPGRRRDEVAARYDLIVGEFRSRILAFNLRAAEAFAEILVARARAGREIQIMDAQIAAIARSRGAAVATRDVGDFAGCGVKIIDPWAHAG